MVNQSRKETIIVPSGESRRIDVYLAERLSVSRSRIQKAIRAYHVTVNSNETRSNYTLSPGDVIEFDIPQPPPISQSVIAQEIPLSIRYEDEYLLVVDKPSGMVVHPAPGTPDGTLVNALLFRFRDLPFRPDDPRPGIVHRLDKDTSGLILVAKTEDVKEKLSVAIIERRVRRTYHAIVFGHLKQREALIDIPIGRHPTDRRRMSTLSTHPRSARTRYRLLESFDVCELLEVNLLTGRTHQIRVHFSSIGHPLVGDSLYRGGRGCERGFSGEQREKARLLLSMMGRQALHACRLQFRHPISGEPVTVESDPPPDFQDLLNYLRESAREA